ncbi:hypothetical protein DL96DRAFT_1638085 [Flagelloscypha sp. PMI_526]|nr:hypothetical protein DL96DRAFT_1638085 [Flagelloscypha sp. PMI_526]
MDAWGCDPFADLGLEELQHEDVALPPELIESIVQFETNQHTLRSLCLVSRVFHLFAQPKIFATVAISKNPHISHRSGYSKPPIRSHERALQHFTSFPHLSKLVRTLVLYSHAQADVLKLFSRIENLFLFDIGRWPDIPEAARNRLETSTFPGLKVLSLRNISLFPFDSVVRNCVLLKHITLDGVSASEIISPIPSSQPPLESFKFLNHTSPELFIQGSFLSLFNNRMMNPRTLHLPSCWEAASDVHAPLLQRFGASLVHLQLQSLPKAKDLDDTLNMHLDSLPQLQSMAFRLPRYSPHFPLQVAKEWLFSLFELTQRHPLQTVEISAPAFSPTLPHPEFITGLRGYLNHRFFFHQPTLTVICEAMVTSPSSHKSFGKLTKFEFAQNE